MGLLLIGVAAWGKGFGLVSSIHIIGGVIAVGVFLLLIAIVGLIGAVHHHQVMLFFVSFDGSWFHAVCPSAPRFGLCRCFFNFLLSVHGHPLHRLPVPVWHFLFLLGDEPWAAGEHFDFTLSP